MLSIALFEPEIPPNTGNIIRLCANTGVDLHIIEPTGFIWCDKRLRRAGLDYQEFTKVTRHCHWEAFLAEKPGTLLGLTTKSSQNYFDFTFDKDGEKNRYSLVLGPETRGLPDDVLQSIGWNMCFRLPMKADSRSLNLSNAAAICLYEALRQLSFPYCLP